MPLTPKFLMKLALRMSLGSTYYEKTQFARHHYYWPDLKHPTRFSEKICARKFDPMASSWIKFVDKVSARDYVASKIGHEYLIDVFDILEGTDRSHLDKYPASFVLKGSHGSGRQYLRFFRSKDSVTTEQIDADVASILNMGRSLWNRFDFFTNELWYSLIPPRVLVEEFLGDSRGNVPPDYKFFVFHGKVRLIQLDTGRYREHMRSFYDTDWNYLDLEFGYPKGPPQPKPECLQAMVQLSEELGNALGQEGLQFARIDLFLIDKSIKFGEITLTPGMGWERINPSDMDNTIGSYW